MTTFEVQGIDIAFIQGGFSEIEDADSFLFEVSNPDDDGFVVFITLDVRTAPGRVTVGSVAHIHVTEGSVADLGDAEILEGINNATLKGPAWTLMTTVARQVAATMQFSPYDPEEFPAAEVRLRPESPATGTAD
ncbi:hypothetical protein [Micrococcus luteus]|uniref:hypothetical protein n=1 Tax=Micrococcus luteus TaxID=1270 RepID=UPI001D0C5496|nr:hypothetical protein [Micrococcus luteus]MCC0765964.1 hypothetical protein [Micrococcus luteus]MCD0184660.1 hypothetical protein [Micrococcus luteus]MCV7661110.1 hypothetical protein [Micrococcus luteus]